MNVPFKQKVFYFCPVLFCFSLPFGSLFLSAIIALWTLSSFFLIDRDQFIKGLKNKTLWLSFSFFITTAVSFLYSSNKIEAISAIEIKLSFILLPYLFFCFKWPLQILQRCVIAFVSGCFFACLYLIFRAITYAYQGNPEYFFYTLFSDFIHASYFAMYLVLAIAFVMLFYHQWFKSQKSIIYSTYFFLIIFVTTIFLCASKLGLISLLICLPILVFYKYIKRFNFKFLLILFIGFASVLFLITKFSIGPIERIKSMTSLNTHNLDKTSHESTAVRLLIWKQALVIIKENIFLGTGAGDANDTLYANYEKEGMIGALSHKLNAHNQYLQSFIGLGIGGFVLLIALTFWQLIKAFYLKNFPLLIFSILIILNFMVESMLQTAAGVLFFVFYFCFFNLVKEEELKVV